MKTLILMRHAKAAAHNPGESDFDRPLAPRGKESAAALGDWLRAEGLTPDLALVSAAARTLETWERLGLADETPMRSLPELYDGVPSIYLQQVAKLSCDSVLVIGHNPTIASLMEHVLGDGEMPIELMAVPTGATMAVTFDTDDWGKAIRSEGVLKAWMIPRSLTDD